MFQVIQSPLSDHQDQKLREWLKSEGAIIARRVVTDKIITLESAACADQLKQADGFENYAKAAAEKWKAINRHAAFLEMLDTLSRETNTFTTVNLQK